MQGDFELRYCQHEKKTKSNTNIRRDLAVYDIKDDEFFSMVLTKIIVPNIGYCT